MNAVAELLLSTVAVMVAAYILGAFWAGHESGLLWALMSGAVFLAAIGILIVMRKIGALSQRTNLEGSKRNGNQSQ
jgi:F0F1-type ATP synthase assembly protein I